MASSKCRLDGCKRNFDTVCAHCQGNFCTKHYFEHVKLANDELAPLADQLNSMINTIQQLNPISQALQQLEQWREMSHRYIDDICNKKKQELKVEVEQKMEGQMNTLLQLSRQVKELIDEGDASFKQIDNIKKNMEECQKQCKEFETTDYVCLKLKPIELEFEKTLTRTELFTGGGTLLSSEQQMKLNEFYGKQGQLWKLIYKATRHGFSSADFHRHCDNQGPTMTVIQSKDGGYLFGGYTSVSWRSTDNYVDDKNDPFLFTLTNPHGIPPTKYSIKNAGCSILDNKNYGPTFGGGADLYVSNDSQATTTSYFNFPHSYGDTTGRGVTTFTGNKYFQTTDIEVYLLV